MIEKNIVRKTSGLVTLLVIYVGFVSCKDEEGENLSDLMLSSTEFVVENEATFAVKVLNSIGDFQVAVEDDSIVNVSVSGKTITLVAISAGSTTVLVTDEENRTSTISITVTDKEQDKEDEDESNNNDEDDESNNDSDGEGEYDNYSNIYYSLSKGSPEMMTVYVKVYDNIYAGYRIVHEINNSHYKNLWRVRESYMHSFDNNQMETLYLILTAGENEFVWASARDDIHEATGGYHGNERIDVDPYGEVEFFANDKLIDMASRITLTPAETFHYIQHSTMHETGTGGPIRSSEYIPVPGHPIECYHEKKTVFSNGGFDTYNKLTWTKNNTPVKTNNFALFCITPDVSTIGYNEAGTQVTFNNNGGMKLESTGSKIVMQNSEKNISVTCDSKLIKPEGYTTSTRIWDRDIYHKYYHCLGGNGEVFQTAEGEVWQSQGSIYFSKIVLL